MHADESPVRNDAAKHLALLKEFDAGRLESLECPECGGPHVAVWFTHPAEAEYRTWFVCERCRFSSRVQNSARPRHYSPARVNKELEAYDAELLAKCRF